MLRLKHTKIDDFRRRSDHPLKFRLESTETKKEHYAEHAAHVAIADLRGIGHGFFADLINVALGF